MAQSMRPAKREPAGILHLDGEILTMESTAAGSWQGRDISGERRRYPITYAIGSGVHATGYITTIEGHLFQSPVALYNRRSGYGLAPGFEQAETPGFTRTVGPACVFCHAGTASSIAGTENAYQAEPFPHLAIGCPRCHGQVEQHLRLPSAANIVNPAGLTGTARDSVCEQCHLAGEARVLNHGKELTDFKAGQPLEDTFTTYHYVSPKGSEANFRVISHSEQLAQSKCARSSEGRLWCGTCHNPPNEPADPVSVYRGHCLTCHAKTAFASSHPGRTSDCAGCHMPKRETADGGHTVFTDHRIQRSPKAPTPSTVELELAPWRLPEPAVRDRNLGIALVGTGLEKRDMKVIVRGYRLLVAAQPMFDQDSELYNAIGTALVAGQNNVEAARAFQLAVSMDPKSSPKEASLGGAYLQARNLAAARLHLERALSLDPLNLKAADLLMRVLVAQGDQAAAARIASRLSLFIDM